VRTWSLTRGRPVRCITSVVTPHLLSRRGNVPNRPDRTTLLDEEEEEKEEEDEEDDEQEGGSGRGDRAEVEEEVGRK